MKKVYAVLNCIQGGIVSVYSFAICLLFFATDHFRHTGYGTPYQPLPMAEALLLLAFVFLASLSFFLVRNLLHK